MDLHVDPPRDLGKEASKPRGLLPQKRGGRWVTRDEQLESFTFYEYVNPTRGSPVILLGCFDKRIL